MCWKVDRLSLGMSEKNTKLVGLFGDHFWLCEGSFAESISYVEVYVPKSRCRPSVSDMYLLLKTVKMAC